MTSYHITDPRIREAVALSLMRPLCAECVSLGCTKRDHKCTGCAVQCWRPA